MTSISQADRSQLFFFGGGVWLGFAYFQLVIFGYCVTQNLIRQNCVTCAQLQVSNAIFHGRFVVWNRASSGVS
jgi:hypothetical protein